MAGKEKSLRSELLQGVRIEAKHIREDRTYSVRPIRVDREPQLLQMENTDATLEVESVDRESLGLTKQESKKNLLIIVEEVGKGSFSTVYKVKNKDLTTDIETTECDTLTKIIHGRRDKNIPIDHHDVVIMLLQQTQAIEYLLKFEIYHCDITPNNVMYNHDTQKSKLIDFGLAKHKNSNADEIEVWEKVVKYAALGGAYAAPERHADKEMGDSSDVYSLAAVLFHLVRLESPPTLDVTQYRKEAEEARKSGVSIPDTAVQERLKTHKWNDDNRKWTIILLRRMLNEASDERPLCSDILDNIRDNMQTNA